MDSTSTLDLLASAQLNPDVTANCLFDAMSPSSLFGRRATTTAALTFGYYGGKYRKADGTILDVTNGTVSLSASATNYILETDGVVSKVTAAPSGWPGPLASGGRALYQVICDASGVNPATWPTGGYKDYRTTGIGAGPASGAAASGVSITDAGSYFAGTDVEAALQELGAGVAGVADVMVFKGVIDCSANPNYPAANAGDLYKVSVAGKIGGASGTDVNAGDSLYCITDSTSAGTQAAVGANWNIANENVTTATHGALINSATGKTTPVDADMLGMADSAASNVMKKLTWASLKATLKTYFDTLYATAAQPFDLLAFYPGVPTASAIVTRAPIARAVTFAANFSGSVGKASVSATGSSAFDIQKNGSSVGTMTFAASGSTASFTSSGGTSVSFAAGDILAIVAPGSADATLANVGIVLAGTR